jgi:hypothetical protein
MRIVDKNSVSGVINIQIKNSAECRSFKRNTQARMIKDILNPILEQKIFQSFLVLTESLYDKNVEFFKAEAKKPRLEDEENSNTNCNTIFEMAKSTFNGIRRVSK